jgi:hypothetical protein
VGEETRAINFLARHFPGRGNFPWEAFGARVHQRGFGNLLATWGEDTGVGTYLD